MAVDEAKLKEALDIMGQAMATLSEREKQQLGDIRKQVDDAANVHNSEPFDKRLEFCYAILFTPEITNERLKGAARMYVDASG